MKKENYSPEKWAERLLAKQLARPNVKDSQIFAIFGNEFSITENIINLLQASNKLHILDKILINRTLEEQAVDALADYMPIKEVDSLMSKTGHNELISEDKLLEDENVTEILRRKDYDLLAKLCKAKPEHWALFDEKASFYNLIFYERLEELERRKAWDFLAATKGGIDVIISKNLPPDILFERLFCTYGYQLRQYFPPDDDYKKKAFEYGIKCGKDYAFFIEYVSDGDLIKLGYSHLVTEAGKWWSLFENKAYNTINWKAWYCQEGVRFDFVWRYAKQANTPEAIAFLKDYKIKHAYHSVFHSCKTAVRMCVLFIIAGIISAWIGSYKSSFELTIMSIVFFAIAALMVVIFSCYFFKNLKKA